MAEQAQREHIELDNAANKLRTKQKHKMDEEGNTFRSDYKGGGTENLCYCRL